MDKTIGTFELVLTWPDGRQERLPHALLREAFTSLPDGSEALRAKLAEWTRSRSVEAQAFDDDELSAVESGLLNTVHTETSELGLLNQIAFRADGQLVNPNGLPEDWPGVRAPFVLALAIQRFRLLNRALGTRVTSIDVDVPKAST